MQIRGYSVDCGVFYSQVLIMALYLKCIFVVSLIHFLVAKLGHGTESYEDIDWPVVDTAVVQFLVQGQSACF